MNLPITFAAVALMSAGILSPVSAQAAPLDSHRHQVRSDYDDNHYQHHKHRSYRTIKVWVPGRYVWFHGHRHFVPGHHEYRRVAYWR
jgi:hypothetical protein